MLTRDALPADELVAFCRRLVQTPSVNGQHPERAVAEEVARFAASHGLAAELLGRDPERPNVLVRAGPPGPTGLLLVAHTDTVAPGDPGAWTAPPFAGDMRDGRIYGRGAIDTKGGLVAALGALLLLARAAPGDLRRPVTLIGVPDEESGATGTLGVRYLHEQGRLEGRGAIYTYPGMHEIVVGHRGVLRLVLEARGTAFHSGSREWQDAAPGHNAVTGLAEILLELERLRLPGGDGGLFAPYRTVLTPTTISGGSGPSIVPPSCSAHVDIRLVPGVSRAAVEAAVQRVVDEVVARRPPLRVETRAAVFIPATEIAPDSAIVASVRAAASEVLGVAPELAVSGPANESYILNGYGIPTCIFGPVGAGAHAADEYVVIDSIFQAARVYARAALILGGA